MGSGRTLSPLTRSLLATTMGLPGMSDLYAQEWESNGLSYRFTDYDEDPLPEGVLLAGSPDRYRIESHQFQLVQGLGEDWILTVSGIHEAMSGSSPWFVLPGPEGEALQVMSGATIHDRRDEVSFALTRQLGDVAHSWGAGISREDDYEANFLSYSGEITSDQTTWSWGGSYSDDLITPSDSEIFDRPEREDKNSVSVSGGWTRVLNRNAVLQSGISFTRLDGYLSDPYKMTFLGTTLANDSRPDKRWRFAWTTQLRHYFEQSRGAFHADFRYYRDDWSVSGQTLSMAWNQPLGEWLGGNWMVAPSVRYHTQRGADFYAPFFDQPPASGYWSADYRLATFGALSWRLELTWRSEYWRASARAEIYDSDGSLAFSGTPQDTPALVDFTRFTLGLERQW